MSTLHLTRTRARPTWAQVVVAAAGIASLLAGLAQLVAPQWFFQQIGNFPPFNRHYVGELGSFLVLLGIGLIMAARRPAKHRTLIGVGAGASLLHTLNHLYDDLGTSFALDHLVVDLLPLLLLAVLLCQVWFDLSPAQPIDGADATE